MLLVDLSGERGEKNKPPTSEGGGMEAPPEGPPEVSLKAQPEAKNTRFMAYNFKFYTLKRYDITANFSSGFVHETGTFYILSPIIRIHWDAPEIWTCRPYLRVSRQY